MQRILTRQGPVTDKRVKTYAHHARVSRRAALVASAVLPFLIMSAVSPRTTCAADPVGSAPRILFLTSEDPDNYEATKTLPVFAERLTEQYGCRCTVLVGRGTPDRFRFDGLDTIKQTDLLVVFFRRRALSTGQLDLVRGYLAAGKPLVGIRTANHAFSVRTDVPAGFEKWWEFVPEVLGCKNAGYGKTEHGTLITVADGAAGHPILAGVKLDNARTGGPLYLQEMVDSKATILLRGAAAKHDEPVAWTRIHGASRVFYTSLGHASAFEIPAFNRLLVNGIFWALDRPVPTAATPNRS